MNFKEFNSNKKGKTVEFFIITLVIFIITLITYKQSLGSIDKEFIFATFICVVTVFLVFLVLHFIKQYFGKDVEYMEQRDSILLAISGNRDSLLADLFDFEINDYPVLIVVKESENKKLIESYLNYVDVRFEENKKKFGESPSGSLSNTRRKLSNLTVISKLPSYVELEVRKAKKTSVWDKCSE